MTTPAADYSARSRELASDVQRLRGWVGKDPSKLGELVDAVNALTTHRVGWHDFTAAAADASDGLGLAARKLTSEGPLGPYTTTQDAARLVTAAVNLATIQLAANRSAEASQTMQTVPMLAGVRPAPEITALLTPSTCLWGLAAGSRLAIAGGDPRGAAGLADACLAIDAPAYGWLDAALAWAGARFAAGRPDEAVARLWAARTRYDDEVASGITASLPDWRVARLIAPAPVLYHRLAQYLWATGDVDSAITVRRGLVDLVDAHGDDGQVAAAETALVADLRAAGRGDEVKDAPRTSPVDRPSVAERVEDWPPVAPGQMFVADTAAEAARRADDAALAAAQEQAQRAQEEARRLEAERSREVAEQARLQTQREAAEAEQRQRELEAAERAEADRLAALEAEEQARGEAEREEAQRRRAERMAEHAAADDQLNAARHAVEAAAGPGERKVAAGRLAELLRPLATEDPVRYGNELVDVLQRQSAAMKADGEWWAARRPAREAKDLARKMGLR